MQSTQSAENLTPFGEQLCSSEIKAGPASGGSSAGHPLLPVLPVIVAPSTSGREKNTLRMELVPVACWRMNDARFALGLSFIRPESRRELGTLTTLIKHYPDCPLTIFGHADPVDTDEENKALSGRRAKAMYAALTRKIALWEHLFDNACDSDRWGLEVIQSILQTLTFPPGPADGHDGPKTQSAVRSFQAAHSLTVTGRADKPTRAKLFEVYMNFLCGPLKLTAADFLSGGIDDEGKGDFQGCGEFNPIVRASESQLVRFAKPQHHAERDEFNAPNRRILILLFRPGTVVPPAKWPCPRASENASACRKRFWSDHQRRRQSEIEPRLFDKTQDTFACRFYHRLTADSPCEYHSRRKRLRIYLHDETGKLLRNEPYTLTIDGEVIAKDALTGPDGLVDHEVSPAAASGVLEILRHTWKLDLRDPDPHADELGVRARLANLGYMHDPESADQNGFEFALVSLQGHAELERTGRIDSPTIRHLDDFHRYA